MEAKRRISAHFVNLVFNNTFFHQSSLEVVLCQSVWAHHYRLKTGHKTHGGGFFQMYLKLGSCVTADLGSKAGLPVRKWWINCLTQVTVFFIEENMDSETYLTN